MEDKIEYTTDTGRLDEWPEILISLSGQMTKQAFDAHFKESTASINGDDLIIHVKSGFIKDWIENRLTDTVARTVENITGKKYTVTAQVAEVVAKRKLASKPQPGQFSSEIIYTDPRQKTIATSVYAIRFWMPILTPDVFLTWLTLRAFAWDGNNEYYPSIETLAMTCSNGNRHALLGRAARKGRPAREGHLYALEKIAFIKIRVEGKGHEKSYYFKVLEELPLLTPIQASWLPPRIEQAHKNWLWSCHLDYEGWKQLALSQ